jgi:hypothetical protein
MRSHFALRCECLREKHPPNRDGTCCAQQGAFFSAIMLIERRQLLATRISWAAAICLTLAGLFIASCDRPTAESNVAGVVLRADPDPVPVGNPNGKTTITWDTGSDAVGDVYVGGAGNEKLFAGGPKGSQDATWIQPGSNEFRLYSHADHKLLAQLTVTMPSSDGPASSPSVSP